LVLVNNHDPVEKGPEAWRVRIGKLTSTPLPRILANTNDFSVGAAEPDATGAVWKLEARERESLLPEPLKSAVQQAV
jgi:hypothetical protein